jgi:hypothetical protein
VYSWLSVSDEDGLCLWFQNKGCLLAMEVAVLGAQETVWRLEKSEKVLEKAVPRANASTTPVTDEVRLHFQQLHSLLQARSVSICTISYKDHNTPVNLEVLI